MTRHIRIKNVIRGGGEASPAERRLHFVYLSVLLAAFSVANGFFALLLAADSCATLWFQAVYESYFAHPPLVLLNLLPAVLLSALGLFLTGRAWAAYLFSAVPTIGCALVNYYKIQLRGDPFLAADLRLIRTAGGILSHYRLGVTRLMLLIALGALAMLLFSVFFLKNGPRGKRVRLGGTLACLALAPLLYTQVYLNDALYERTVNNDAIHYERSELEIFVSRGFWYPFLRSVPKAFPSVPRGYSAREADAILASYPGADIPREKKVNVVGVMLEAFSDLSDYPMLAEEENVAALYAPLHELESACVSGELLTNIFAGGTVDSEWGFLTGYSRHGEFRSNVDSYVRYFNAQGYDTFYRHPGYAWFYNRQNVNAYLGFDESVFTENGFSQYVNVKAAPWHSDRQLFDYLLRDLDARTAESPPLFDFAMSYQNHGPYDATSAEHAIVDPEGARWSAESRGILDHYLTGIADTISELRRFTNELEARDIPVVLVIYGDHKPWLGNNNSVYTELGIVLDPSTKEGFYNYYATPYLIWANSAAKRVLGNDFTGTAGDFSPCFLMPALFDLCAWDGPPFMALARELRAYTPLVHEQGFYLENGVLTDTLSPEAEALYLRYRCAEYRRETKGIE